MDGRHDSPYINGFCGKRRLAGMSLYDYDFRGLVALYKYRFVFAVAYLRVEGNGRSKDRRAGVWSFVCFHGLVSFLVRSGSKHWQGVGPVFAALYCMVRYITRRGWSSRWKRHWLDLSVLKDTPLRFTCWRTSCFVQVP